MAQLNAIHVWIIVVNTDLSQDIPMDLRTSFKSQGLTGNSMEHSGVEQGVELMK